MQNDSTKQENSGFEPCEKCNGQGWVSMIPTDPKCKYVKSCPLCEGEGVVDWVRKIMGYSKPDPFPLDPWMSVKPAVTNFKIPKGVSEE